MRRNATSNLLINNVYLHESPRQLSQLTREEVKELQDFAFLHVNSVMCFGMRKCIKRWEEFNETTVEGGEYLKELHLREGD